MGAGKERPLRRVTVTVPAERSEEARALLLELFPEGFEESVGARSVELSAYTDALGAAKLWRAFGDYSSSEVPADWADRWRSFHRPVRVGPLWLGPPWAEPPPGAVPVVIEPGRAFGTGAHETTRLCAELVLTLDRGSLLDVGCGSGVLAIAAAQLGFEPVYAVDHDEVAVETARANAAANGTVVEVRLADGLEDALPRTDIVVANISASAVEALAARLSARLLVSSGYLVSDRLPLPGWRRRERRSAGTWAADIWSRES